MDEIIKVCAYCRVSTDSNDQANSFENQKDFFEKYAEKNPNFELVEIYSDKGFTGTSFDKREGFNQMLFDAGIDVETYKRKVNLIISEERKPKFKYILVKNSSRFARNMQIVVLIDELKKAGVYIKFLDIDLSTETRDEQFLINFFLNFDQQESVDKSKKVKWGHERGAEKGNIHVNSSIYGFEYLPSENRLEIIEEEAEVIRKIFDMYTNHNLGFRKIVEKLNELEIKTRKNKEFCKSTIQRILTNEKYYGALVRQKWSSGEVFNKHSPKIRPEEEWIVHEDHPNIPPIISKEVFAKAQAILKSRTKDSKGVYIRKTKYAGLIVCGKCKANYTRNSDKGRYFFNCSTKKTKGLKECDNLNVSLTDLEEFIDYLAVEGLYNSILKSKNEKISLLIQLKEKMMIQINQENIDEVNKKKELVNDLMIKKEKLLDLYMDGIFDKKTLDERVEKLNHVLSTYGREISLLTKPNEEIKKEINEIDNRLSELKKLEVNKSYTSEEVLEMIEEIEVKNDGYFFALIVKFKVIETINKIIDKYLDDISISKIPSYIKPLKFPPNYKYPELTHVFIHPDAIQEKEEQGMVRVRLNTED